MRAHVNFLAKKLKLRRDYFSRALLYISFLRLQFLRALHNILSALQKEFPYQSPPEEMHSPSILTRINSFLTRVNKLGVQNIAASVFCKDCYI